MTEPCIVKSRLNDFFTAAFIPENVGYYIVSIHQRKDPFTS